MGTRRSDNSSSHGQQRARLWLPGGPAPAGYKEHGRFEQPDQSGKETWAHPVIANGKLYRRDQDVLLCYDVKGK